MNYGQINITEEIGTRQQDIERLQKQIAELRLLRGQLKSLQARAVAALADNEAESDYNAVRREASQLRAKLFHGGISLDLTLPPEHWKII